jgi:hypothetical protein
MVKLIREIIPEKVWISDDFEKTEEGKRFREYIEYFWRWNKDVQS